MQSNQSPNKLINKFKRLNFGLIVYNFRCNRVNRFNPFEPHIINRGVQHFCGLSLITKSRLSAIFEVFEQNGCEIRNKKKIGHPLNYLFT
ncbi:hypothetical protein BpHYR1_040254 [Brachionus plicatilis]|uniref:Uncharacterized protein n=1 Tax=Brachionus plicatilis TaxID=10195 RepID=A0A3M7RS48_BRAPC|nr:hypothetical protein BpHYR1_040254 [Brachionus plicatilis]